MTIEALNEKIKQLAPAEHNSIIIDNAIPVKQYNYCYIVAKIQRVEYHTQKICAALNGELKQSLEEIINSTDRYVPVNERLVTLMKEAPEYDMEGFFSSVKKKMNEMINGGREVDHHHITLSTADGHLTKQQPSFAIKNECMISKCTHCDGKTFIVRTNKQGIDEKVQCPECEGRGIVGTFTYFTPEIIEKETRLVRCLSGDIEGLKFDFLPNGLVIGGTSYKIANGEFKSMLAHFNGIDTEDFDSDILPYIDIVRDKVGEENAIEDYFYHIIPCYTFTYRNILTNELHSGIVVDPNGQPALLLNMESSGSKFVSGVKDGMKSIGNFFGSISRSQSFKDKEDLRRTLRLLIAVAVADGIVDEEEKKTLTLAIRGMDQFTSSEQEELVKNLGEKDAKFLTDDDYHFHNPKNAAETLTRMQELAESDREVHETEREIIEKLRFSM